ncbi:MAG: HlyC/CorC family transporter [Candidatus Eremiobacteraeota bacterium]|nr:HlyC/CorC family transporter [Candidatus Eremiobacteraeota bacterium]MCW5871442.1 HlyC/CorC family transporter [Candidatus Eremiobacteraeota bacterium]
MLSLAETSSFDSFSTGPLLGIVAFFLAVNGFFVALEFALVALRETKVDEMVREGVRGAKHVQHGKRNVDDYVAAAQLGITIASLVLGAAGEALFRKPLSAAGLSSPVALTLLSLALMTMLHVVVGEQVPKMLAIQFPQRVALTAAPATALFLRLCRPGIWFLSKMTSLILRLLGIRGAGSGHGHTAQIYSEEEIQALLGLREAAGLSEQAESLMVSRVFSFFDMVATQVMVPRTEMVCVPSDSTLRDLAALASEERHERYPVYGENLDDIKGVVLLKDVISAINQQRGLDAPVTTVMREIFAVPGSKGVSKLMREMKKHRTRLALVLDEYGGTAGMVTYGDLLERIVGEVEESTTPVEDEDIVTLGDNLYSVSGLVVISDVEEQFDVDIDDEHNDTIGGTVFSQLGRKPQVGDVVEAFGLRLEVESMDGLRIDRLKVAKLVRTPEDELHDSHEAKG